MCSRMSPSTKIDKDNYGTSFDEKRCWGMIGSLSYLIVSILIYMFSVLYACRQSCPKESRLKVLKRVFRYLNGIINLGPLEDLWPTPTFSFHRCSAIFVTIDLSDENISKLHNIRSTTVTCMSYSCGSFSG